jgi:hypothetical protein
MHWVREHKPVVLGLGAVVAVGVVFALVWFQPQKLFVDDVVNETIPEATNTTVPDDNMVTDTTTTTSPASGVSASEQGNQPSTFPLILTDGMFIDLAHPGTGVARVLELEDGTLLLRFEDLDVFNGPDLRVILSRSELVNDDGAYDDGAFLDLGVLKGNQGNQNYEIPADVDLKDYLTVAIWCRRFNVTFNAAPLTRQGV